MTKHFIEHASAADVWLFVVSMVFLIGCYCWVAAKSEKNPPALRQGAKQAHGEKGSKEDVLL